MEILEPEVIVTEKIKTEPVDVNIDEIFDDINNENINTSTSDDDEQNEENDENEDDEENRSTYIPPDKILSKKAERICEIIEGICPNYNDNEFNLKNQKTALLYFYDYFPKDMFKTIAEQTKLYSNINKENENFIIDDLQIQEFFAFHIIMNIIKYPQYSMYWSPLFRVRSIADRITRERFEQLRNILCIVKQKPPKLNGKRDNLWKVRPIVDSFVLKCQNLAKDENPCIDDQMIPFLLYLNSIQLKTQRKVLRVLFALVGLAVKNSWLEYKKDAEKIVKNKMDIMDLLEFQLRTAELLLKNGRSIPGWKRQRSNSLDGDIGGGNSTPSGCGVIVSPNEQQALKKQRLSSSRPQEDVRYDGIEHWPIMDKKPQRCKMEGCDKKASVRCEKCNVNLCMSSNRNCYKIFHIDRRY